MSGAALERRKRHAGTTLVELIITIAAGSIVILGVYRLLTTSLRSYNLQDQITDMYMNGTYCIKKLDEVLAQVGSTLPDTPYVVVNPASVSDVSIKVNYYGARQAFTSNLSSTAKIPVDSGKTFIGNDSIVVDTGIGPPLTRQIDSVKVSSVPCTVYLKSPATATLQSGAVVYAASTYRYYFSNKNFCLNSDSNVLAENIDSAAIVFLDTGGNSTTDWKRMRSASLFVRARNADPDQPYTNPTFGDHYHRLSLSMKLRLRNKF